MNACRADACQQGRVACPCPLACRVPIEPVEASWPRLWLGYGLAIFDGVIWSYVLAPFFNHFAGFA